MMIQKKERKKIEELFSKSDSAFIQSLDKKD